MSAVHSHTNSDLYQPVIPAFTPEELSCRDHIDNLVERIDLRLLYPAMHGKSFKVPCPFHRDEKNPSLAIFRANIYCFTCNTSRGALEAIAALCKTKTQGELYAIARYLMGSAVAVAQPKATHSAPLDETLIRTHRRILQTTPGRQNYLAFHYGLSLAAQDTLQLGHSGIAFVIPVRNVTGQLMNLRYRRDPERWPDPAPPQHPPPRYWGVEGRNAPQWYIPPGISGPTLREAIQPSFDGKRSVVLCEGELKAGALYALFGLPAISATNGVDGILKMDLNELAGLFVFVMFDTDTAGQKGAQEVVQRLHDLHVEAALVSLPADRRRKNTQVTDLIREGWQRRDFVRQMRQEVTT